ncbi:MAG: hypothetical protein M3015_00185 [Bacteroidota bacterium]|nr:hypothetical protein [Bacteroidota bacterium]
MKPNKLISILFFFFLFINLAGMNANGQACKDIYNNALGNYNRGQFENINNELNGCIADFNSNREAYRQSQQGKDINAVFKVYKLIITSYRNLDKENLAVAKTNELIAFFANKLTAQDVQGRLNNTQLAPM